MENLTEVMDVQILAEIEWWRIVTPAKVLSREEVETPARELILKACGEDVSQFKFEGKSPFQNDQ